MVKDSIILHTPHNVVRMASLQEMKPTSDEVKSIAEVCEAS